MEAVPALSEESAAPSARYLSGDAASWLDGLLHAAEGRATGGLSPIAQGLALFDWGLSWAEPRQGSWWPTWGHWLDEKSTGRVAARALGSAQHAELCPAPGTCILQK